MYVKLAAALILFFSPMLQANGGGPTIISITDAVFKTPSTKGIGTTLSIDCAMGFVGGFTIPVDTKVVWQVSNQSSKKITGPIKFDSATSVLKLGIDLYLGAGGGLAFAAGGSGKEIGIDGNGKLYFLEQILPLMDLLVFYLT